MKLYLAGPMRGLPENNAPAFHVAAARLRALGHTVWSPAEEDAVLAVDAVNTDLRRTFTRDLVALLEADAVVLIDGWSRSHGACLERHTADVCDVPVYMEAPGTELGMVRLSRADWRWRARMSAA